MDTSSTAVELITPGFLGSCWYGKYHYLEPWIGCEHRCHYCYAISRKIVVNSLNKHQTTFPKPKLLFPRDILIEKIPEAIKTHKVKTLKLCRYTDIFTPSFVRNQLSLDILTALCGSSVERIIITTKGIPNQSIIDLLIKYKEKFSYNTVIKPACEKILEPENGDNEKKLQVLQTLQQAGVKTTVHMDPLLFSIFLSETEWITFLENIKSRGLQRIMFSYLMVDHSILNHLRQQITEKDFQKIIDCIDYQETLSDCGVDEPLFHLKQEIRFRHIEFLSDLLEKMGFQYVLCSLKSARHHSVNALGSHCNLCDGTFYA